MMSKEKVDSKIVITALICITIIELYALHQGMNGTILSLVLALIAGLAGLILPTPKILQK